MALIIFVKNPIEGRVKTRLAKTIGSQKALAIYRRLLEHTRNLALSIQLEKFLFYDEYIDAHDMWDSEVFHKQIQVGHNLGARMANAFNAVLTFHDRAVIIGSDCPGLDAVIIQEAYDRLSSYDIVIGPAFDGGYYLIGMNQTHPCLFENLEWSTDTVFKTTMDRCRENDLSVHKLPILRDIDDENDLRILGF